jgi:hypothetical protein
MEELYDESIINVKYVSKSDSLRISLIITGASESNINLQYAYIDTTSLVHIL